MFARWADKKVRRMIIGTHLPFVLPNDDGQHDMIRDFYVKRGWKLLSEMRPLNVQSGQKKNLWCQNTMRSLRQGGQDAGHSAARYLRPPPGYMIHAT